MSSARPTPVSEGAEDERLGEDARHQEVDVVDAAGEGWRRRRRSAKSSTNMIGWTRRRSSSGHPRMLLERCARPSTRAVGERSRRSWRRSGVATVAAASPAPLGRLVGGLSSARVPGEREEHVVEAWAAAGRRRRSRCPPRPEPPDAPRPSASGSAASGDRDRRPRRPAARRSPERSAQHRGDRASRSPGRRPDLEPLAADLVASARRPCPRR